VILNSASFDENTSLVSHIARRGSRGLLIGVVVLHGVASRRNGAVALLRFLRIARVPYLDLLDVRGIPTSSIELVLQIDTVVTI
jgi:hypothetical protein